MEGNGCYLFSARLVEVVLFALLTWPLDTARPVWHLRRQVEFLFGIGYRFGVGFPFEN